MTLRAPPGICPAQILLCLIKPALSLPSQVWQLSAISAHPHRPGKLPARLAGLSYAFHPCRSYGFDPFGLGQVPSNLQRFQEAELVHCRWAMLGAAGALAPELLGFGDWYSAPQWVRN